MMKQETGNRLKGVVRTKSIWRVFYYNLQPASYNPRHAFTLIETLIAISILTLSIVAPMSLATQSLSSSYYAHDQVAAFHLAQEGIELVRSIRDGNILQMTRNNSNIDLLENIPVPGTFVIDARNNRITSCDQNLDADPESDCPPLRTDGNFYAYGPLAGTVSIYTVPPGWTDTNLTRTITTSVVRDSNGVPEEVNVSVTVEWKTGRFNTRTFTISENMYRWVQDQQSGTAPDLTFTATPVFITVGQSSTLTWSSTNATSCATPSPGSISKPTSGSDVVSPSGTTMYSLICTGLGGSITKSVTVIVDSGPCVACGPDPF